MAQAITVRPPKPIPSNELFLGLVLHNLKDFMCKMYSYFSVFIADNQGFEGSDRYSGSSSIFEDSIQVCSCSRKRQGKGKGNGHDTECYADTIS
jgi:hypothetical protein